MNSYTLIKTLFWKFKNLKFDHQVKQSWFSKKETFQEVSVIEISYYYLCASYQYDLAYLSFFLFLLYFKKSGIRGHDLLVVLPQKKTKLTFLKDKTFKQKMNMKI